MYRKQISHFVQFYCRCLLPNGHIGHRLNHRKLSLWYHKASAKQNALRPDKRTSWTSFIILLPEFFFAVVTDSTGMVIVYVVFKIFFTVKSLITVIHRCPTFVRFFISFIPFSGSNGWHHERVPKGKGLSQAFRGGWQSGVELGFPVLHPYVLPQSLFRGCFVITMVAFGWQGIASCFFNGISNCRVLFLFQEFFLASCISPERWGAAPLLGHWGHRCLDPGVQGEGEGGANCKREVECHTLAGQRLAEVQALGGQDGITFTHCSRFCVLLN